MFDEPDEISTDEEDSAHDGDGACMDCDRVGCCPHNGCGACSKCLGVHMQDRM